MKSYKIFILFIMFFLIGCATGKIIGNSIINEHKFFTCKLLSDDWKMTVNSSYGPTVLQFRHKKDRTYISIFTLTLGRAEEYVESIDVLNRHFERMEEGRRNFKLISKGATNLGGILGGYGIAEYENPRNRKPMKAKATDAYFKGRTYSIYLYAEKENFDRHVAEYDDFVNSFKFLKE